MNKYICPKDCPDRKVTADYNCHSHCEIYRKFNNRQKLIRAMRFRLFEQTQARFEVKEKVNKIALKHEKRDRERR